MADDMTEEQARAAGYVPLDEAQQPAAPAPTDDMTEAQARAAGYVPAEEAQQQAPDTGLGALEAIPAGIKGGFQSLSGGVSEIAGNRAEDEVKPDLSGTAAQITYGLFRSAPAIIAGLGAGVAGTIFSGGNPLAGLAAGGLGYGAVQGIQDLHDAYQEALQKYPNDTDRAFDEAKKVATISGIGGAVSWAAFPLGGAGNAILKHIIVQAAAVQPAIGMAQQAAGNLAKGDSVTEGVLAAGAQNALLTGALMGAHAGVRGTVGAIKGYGAERDAIKRNTELAALRKEPAQPGMEAQQELPLEEPNPSNAYTKQQELDLTKPDVMPTKQGELSLKTPVLVEDEQGKLDLQPPPPGEGRQTDMNLKSPQLVPSEQGELLLPQGEMPTKQLEMDYTRPDIPQTPPAIGNAATPPRPIGANRPPVTYPKASLAAEAPKLTEGQPADEAAALAHQLGSEQTQEQQAAGRGELPLINRPPFPENQQQLPLQMPPQQGEIPLVQRPPFPEREPQQTNLPLETQRELPLGQPVPKVEPEPKQLNLPEETQLPLLSNKELPYQPKPPAATQAAIEASKAPKAGLSFSNNIINRIFNPQATSPEAATMDMMLRKANGYKRAMSNRFYAALEPARALVNAAPTQDKVNVQIGANTGNLDVVRPDLRPVVAIMAKDAKFIEEDLKKLPFFEQQRFFETFFPQRWKNVASATDFTTKWFQNQGGLGPLKERVWPTIPDGLRAGLELADTDPIKVWSDYHNNMRKVIARYQVTDAMINNGLAMYPEGPTMGPDGHLQPARDMTGWTPLAGNTGPKQLWAPNDVARLYNNWTRAAFAGNPEAQTVWDAAQRLSNQMTGLLFGLNGFHGSTMAGETSFNEIGRGIGLMLSGARSGVTSDIIEGAKKIGLSPASPVLRTIQGNKLIKGYMNPELIADPTTKNIMQMFEDVDAPITKNLDKSYQYTSGENLYTAWKRGSLGQEFKDSINRVLARDNIGSQGAQATAELIDGVGRVLKTVAAPLFDYVIPRMKVASSYETMRLWLDRNPNASPQEKLRMAAHITNSTDNTMGEMNYDNLHWNKGATQVLQTFMSAPTWAIGTLRALGGGIYNLAKHPMSAADPRSPNFNANAQYMLGFLLGAPAMNLTYQYFKTHTNPDDPLDLVAPKTGGKLVDGQPERALLPGYEKELLGWYNSPTSEMYNKLSSPVRLMIEALENKDYRNLMIYNEQGGPMEKIGEFAKHAALTAGPISLQNILTAPKRGSNISAPERIMAIRAASPKQADSARFFAQQQKYQTKAWKQKLRADAKDAASRVQ